MAIALSSESLEVRPATASAPLSLSWAESLEEVDALEDPWRRMDARLANPLSQYIWNRSALAAFAAEADACGLAAVAGDELMAVAPLAARRVHGVRRLCMAGVAQLFEPADFAWTLPRALDCLIARLVRSGSPLFLERVPADSPSLHKL